MSEWVRHEQLKWVRVCPTDAPLLARGSLDFLLGFGSELVVEDGEEGAGRDGDLGNGGPFAGGIFKTEPGLAADGAAELVDGRIGVDAAGERGAGAGDPEGEVLAEDAVLLKVGWGAVALGGPGGGAIVGGLEVAHCEREEGGAHCAEDGLGTLGGGGHAGESGADVVLRDAEANGGHV